MFRLAVYASDPAPVGKPLLCATPIPDWAATDVDRSLERVPTCDAVGSAISSGMGLDDCLKPPPMDDLLGKLTLHLRFNVQLSIADDTATCTIVQPASCFGRNEARSTDYTGDTYSPTTYARCYEASASGPN